MRLTSAVDHAPPPEFPGERNRPPRTGNRFPVIVSICLLMVALVVVYLRRPARHFEASLYSRLIRVEARGLNLIPESDRPVDRVVTGLNVITDKYYLLPEVTAREDMGKERLLTFRKNLYWMDLELSHGSFWRKFPEETVFYVGVPVDPSSGKPSKKERVWFGEYLQKRWGWTARAVRTRIRFFDVPTVVLFAQDIGEVVGRDDEDRVILALGDDEPLWYRTAAWNLVNAYPDDFKILSAGPSVSTEGGDLALTWGPDDRPWFFAGRFAALRYLARLYGDFPADRAVPPEQIVQTRSAYQAALLDMPVRFLPKIVLADPTRGDPELFHLDMVAAFIGGTTRPGVVVPTYVDRAWDGQPGKPLDVSFRKRCQREYDLCALELSAMGFDVLRLPFNDHPVRGPANLVAYRNRTENRDVVLLPKYPTLESPPGQVCGQALIRESLNNFYAWGMAWQAQPNDANWNWMMNAMAQVWNRMGALEYEENPVFNAQRAVLEGKGMKVVPVPIHIWGSGGLHCLTLR